MTSSRKPPPWDAGLKLVHCLDGPRGGSWYFLEHGASSWHELRRLALEHGESPHSGRTLGYVATRETVSHAKYSDVAGHVLAWAPDVAAEAIARKERRPA